MLNSRCPVQLTTNTPYFSTKPPGRVLGNRGENAEALTVNLKGKNANGVPRTPFQPAQRQKVAKDQKHGTTTTTAHPLTDKTPLPNRIGSILFQTPFSQKHNVKSTKLALVDPGAINETKYVKYGGSAGKSPDSVQRPSSMRKHVKHPRSATQNFETPMNRGNHWDISDGEIVLPVDMQPALQDTIVRNEDDFDEIEYMPPNTLNFPYEPPLDFELPDYITLGKNMWRLAHSCPYDDSPSPPEPEIVVSDLVSSTWDMLTLPPLSLEDDPFHQARVELGQEALGKLPVPTPKTKVVTTTGLQPYSLARQPINHTNPLLVSKTTRNISQPQHFLPIPNTRPETSTSIGTATTNGTNVKGKGTTSKITKSVPPPTSINSKSVAGTTATKSALSGPAKSTHHKSAVSLSSRPAGVVTRAATSTVRRPHTALDINRRRDKPAAGVQGALMLVKDLQAKGDVVGEDFLFDV